MINSGFIAGGTGAGGIGVVLDAGGALTNNSGGTISGFYGVSGAGAATVSNDASIGGVNGGIYVKGAAGTVTNAGAITAMEPAATASGLPPAAVSATRVPARSVGGSTD